MPPATHHTETLLPQRVAILGCTGSIGTQTLQVIQQFSKQLTVTGLFAGSNTKLFAEQLAAFSPRHAGLKNKACWQQLGDVDSSVEHYTGTDGLCAMATHPEVDIVVVGLVGAVGIEPTLAALKAGKRVLTANKETFVAAGHLIQPYLNQIIPIDSEHSAIYQCLVGCRPQDVERLWLTASGGPFRTWSKQKMAAVTPAQALKHPNWSMGAKISIDSATMMNKGLEVIEAHWLFGVPVHHIQIIVHPQSTVHSGIEFIDGSVLTQWGTADMRVPIQYGFSAPYRWKTPFVNEVVLPASELSTLDFEPPDEERFPALRLAKQAAKEGGWATTVLNAANEVAVARFLNEEIGFLQIPQCVEDTMAACTNRVSAPALDEVLQLDEWARDASQQWVPASTAVPC
jgi:1-deoxy-D-xylulose-5-phosphate reductoisomerase